MKELAGECLRPRFVKVMSTERGNVKKRGPHHKNTTKFKHNKNSKKTKKILSNPIEGLCKRCHQKIEWRKQYRKYKPLTTPKKCVKCGQKRVIRAYHIVCEDCAVKWKICAKCLEARDILNCYKSQIEDKTPEVFLQGLKERQRRTYLRLLSQGKNPLSEMSIDGSEEISSDGEVESWEEDNENDDDINNAVLTKALVEANNKLSQIDLKPEAKIKQADQITQNHEELSQNRLNHNSRTKDKSSINNSFLEESECSRSDTDKQNNKSDSQ
jgi:hypothetical protein